MARMYFASQTDIQRARERVFVCATEYHTLQPVLHC